MEAKSTRWRTDKLFIKKLNNKTDTDITDEIEVIN
jgi:hypothetical protein